MSLGECLERAVTGVRSAGMIVMRGFEEFTKDQRVCLYSGLASTLESIEILLESIGKSRAARRIPATSLKELIIQIKNMRDNSEPAATQTEATIGSRINAPDEVTLANAQERPE